MISSLNMSEMFPACFSSCNKFNLSQNSLESDDKNFVFEIPEAMIAGDLSKFIRALYLEWIFYLDILHRNAFLLQNHTIIFHPLI